METKYKVNFYNYPKCRKLIKDLGIEGYGIYVYLSHALISSCNDPLDFRILDYMANETKTEYNKIRTVITEYGLFEYSDTEFWLPKEQTKETE